MTETWRIIVGFSMLAGFPVWFWWWIQSPGVLVFLYAVLGWAVLAAYLTASGLAGWVSS